MSRPKSPALTDAELRIMRVLWARGRATVGDVVERIEGAPRPAHNTVLTLLRILEDKGYVSREKAGRAHEYEAIVGRRDAQRTALSVVLSRFFDDSREDLVLNLLGRDEPDGEDLRKVRELIAGTAVAAPAPRRSRR
jgi:predicted transcriptional regulator